MARTDELKERIRQQPLNDRLEESRRRIGDMCSKGRCPKMTIPVQHDDDDFYINTTLADAQATIATLQARVKELEEITKVICGHCCEPMEIPSKAVLQSALTQRTAELEAAKAIQVIDLKNNNEYREQVANLHAELERVRGLIKALPKVEGEIEVKL